MVTVLDEVPAVELPVVRLPQAAHVYFGVTVTFTFATLVPELKPPTGILLFV